MCEIGFQMDCVEQQHIKKLV